VWAVQLHAARPDETGIPALEVWLGEALDVALHARGQAQGPRGGGDWNRGGEPVKACATKELTGLEVFAGEGARD
jgi:hypothetical protein